MRIFASHLIKLLLFILLFLGFIFTLLFLEHRLDKIYPLNLTHPHYNHHPERLKKIIPAKFHSLMGELFWLKMVQFTYSEKFTSQEPIETLFHLFTIVTTLEPNLLSAYDYTLMIYSTIPESNKFEIYNNMLKILNKGIKDFPTHWVFYIQKAQIKNKFQDYEDATQVLDRGSLLFGSPAVLAIFTFYNALYTKDYETIRNVLINMNKKNLRPEEKDWLNMNANWFKTVQDRGALNKSINYFYQKTGHYPIQSWAKLSVKYLFGLLTLAPQDAYGYNYHMDKLNGKVSIDSASPLYFLDRNYENSFQRKKRQLKNL